MNKPLRYLLQAFNFSMFMALVWYFSLYPAYHQLEEDQAMITFTVSHAGKHIRECVKFSQEELLKLPPNMRKPMDCPRERSPISMELKLDDEVIYSKVAPPHGLYSDQGIDIYQNIRVPAGKHRLTAWLNDDVKVEGPIYKLSQDVTLKPEQHLVIEFKPAISGFDVH
ncbi:MAG: hypothetical protein OQK76_01430 [Gammaproteobacteria bacterium]|nr:hypothetical protein [Gammaproteobacteria bacterium]MCW9005605.1 hypothetical protein [Gammaproteobacteria bacterium]MCW9056402.1 hypothetical protein [Gammaproteobacteria bacterium]